MNCRQRVSLSTVFVACCLAALPPACGADRPNVLIVMTDDQGWGDVHRHGNDALDTPTLDRLAQQGAHLDRFYVSPVCAPTRASLLTGRYFLRCGVHGVTRGQESMDPREITLAEVLRSAGYATGCFGKWHNGAHWPMHPNGQGFDEFVGFCAGHWNNYFDTTLQRNGVEFRSDGYISDVLTDEAIAFMRARRDGPFLCYVPYNAPHSPFQVPDRHFDKYKAAGLDDRLACVYAMCENLDDNIGRLLAALDELDLADNTIVLFTTDNGPNTDRFNGGMRGRKGSVHEGGVRVPLFVRWPGHIEPGHEVSQIASHIDILPTIAEWCGAQLAAPHRRRLDGVSLAPLLTGRAGDWPDRMIFTHHHRSRRGAVRTQRWRAVNEGRGWQLFDMPADPGQKRNVAAEQPDVVRRLAGAYDRAYDAMVPEPMTPLPIPVGHPEWPVVTAPAHEAFLQPESGQGIRYVGEKGWANDWITGWTDTAAFPRWELDVVRPGRHEVTLLYNCAAEDVGARVRVQVGGAPLEGVVDKAFSEPPLPSPDRVPRGEVFERRWAELTLGVVALPAGRTQLDVRALSRPGRSVMELKAVRLRQLQ